MWLSFQVNDDEFEKRKRKEEAKLQEKKLVEKANAAPIKPSPFSLLSNLTPAELEEHYTQCIRMCNQNVSIKMSSVKGCFSI